MAAELPVLSFPTAESFAAWLDAEHDASTGLWLKIPKKDSGEQGVDYRQALTVALCYGWIDGQKKAHDDRFWLQRFTPRSARSKWSKINTDLATELIGTGTMRPAGLREVDRAKSDGRWDAAYAGQRTATVPDDLAEALAEDPVARAFFDELDNGNRYAILYRVQDAKRPETRAARIATFVTMLREGRTVHPRPRSSATSRNTAASDPD